MTLCVIIFKPGICTGCMLNPRIVAWWGLCADCASVMSFFVMLPMLALRTGILCSLRSCISASRLPRLSALMVSPSLSWVVVTLVISASSFCFVS